MHFNGVSPKCLLNKYNFIATEQIDLFSLGGLFSHCRLRDVFLRISLLSTLKLFIHIHGTI